MDEKGILWHFIGVVPQCYCDAPVHCAGDRSIFSLAVAGKYYTAKKVL